MTTPLLVYTRTSGYRHDSIPAGVAALRGLDGYTVDATEDPAAFRPDLLSSYAAVVFVSTSEDILDDAGRDALKGYVTGGGSWLGIHCAAASEYHWPWFGELVGARFDEHPEIQDGTIVVEDHDHPSTRHLGPTWAWRDEWYNFRSNPRPDVRVLLTADEASYDGGTMGADHPLAWCHDRLGGRSFYTALGHISEAYADAAFLAHLGGALAWLTT